MRREKDDSDVLSLVTRFEKERARGHTVYFDVEDFEQIAGYYLEIGNINSGSEVIRSGLKIHPNSEALYVKKVELYLQTGDVQSAMILLDKLPEDDDVCMLRAAAYLKTDRKKEALAILHKQIKEDPCKDEICLDVAELLMSNQCEKEALSVLKVGMAFNSHNKDLYYMAIDCCESIDQQEDSLEYIRHLLDEDPYDWESWAQFAETCSVLERYEEAADAYDFAIVAAPKASDSLYRCWGEALLQAGQYQKAIQCFERLLANTASNAEKSELLVYIAEAYEKEEQYPTAFDRYRQAMELNPADERAYLGLGICSTELEKYEEALFYFEEVITKVNPDSQEVWVYLAEFYVKTDKIELAIEAYKTALKKESAWAEVSFALANLYFQQKDYTHALEYYRNAEQSDATLGNLYLFEALACTMLHLDNEAEYALKLAIDQDPSAKMLYDKLLMEEREA